VRPPTVAVAGNINGDIVYSLDRLPHLGETLLARGLTVGPGGKASNESVALARLGATPRLVGSVGDDAIGTMVLERLCAAGVDTAHVVRQPGGTTGIATVLVDNKAENAIVTNLGANMSMQPGDLPSFDGCDALLLTLGLPGPVLLAACRAARVARMLVVVDTTPLSSRVLPPALASADVLSANAVETAQLTGLEPADDAGITECCRRLHALGGARVVLKLGKDGAATYDGDVFGRVSSPQVDAVDPTGAGDAFMAGLVVRLLEGDKLEDAARFACAVGALATLGRGAQAGWTTLDDVIRLLGAEG